MARSLHEFCVQNSTATSACNGAATNASTSASDPSVPSVSRMPSMSSSGPYTSASAFTVSANTSASAFTVSAYRASCADCATANARAAATACYSNSGLAIKILNIPKKRVLSGLRG
jgi:hypothetical protein